MPTKASAALHADAERVAVSLRESVDGIEGVCLYGSVARGTAANKSDIDLIVLGSDPSLTRSQLRRGLPRDLRDLPMSLDYHTPTTLDRYLRNWSRFGAHLRTEGTVLFDLHGSLGNLLERDLPVSTVEELGVQRRHLSNYRHLERFGDQFLFPLAGLYRIGRTLAFVLLAERGELIYNANAAFALLAEHHPNRREEIGAVKRVKPFYDLVTQRGNSASLPFEPVGCAGEVTVTRDAIERLLALSQERNAAG
jgi:predicted nucleotidyltransferase